MLVVDRAVPLIRPLRHQRVDKRIVDRLRTLRYVAVGHVRGLFRSQLHVLINRAFVQRNRSDEMCIRDRVSTINFLIEPVL